MVSEWLNIVGWTLGAIGVGVLAFALFRDRSRGRRRCPGCWYDMSRVPGMTCPECGRAARKEKRLFRTRRRWRLAMIGLAISLGGVAAGNVERVREDGWLSLVPTDVLLLLLPGPDDVVVLDARTRIYRLHVIAGELERRAGSSEFSFTKRQWRWIIDRTEAIGMREGWPAGMPLDISVELPVWLSSFSIEVKPRLADGRWALCPAQLPAMLISDDTGWDWTPVGTPDQYADHVEFDVVIGTRTPFGARAGPAVFEGVFVRPLRCEGTHDEVVVPVREDGADEAVRRALKIIKPRWVGARFVELRIDRSALGEYADMAMTLEITYELQGDVATIKAPWGSRFWRPQPGESETDGTRGISIHMPEADEAGARWRVHVKGVPDGVLADWRRNR